MVAVTGRAPTSAPLSTETSSPARGVRPLHVRLGEVPGFGVVSTVRWPCGRDAQPRPDCHQRRIVRHTAGGLGYWFGLRGRCRIGTGVMPGYAKDVKLRSDAAHRRAREAAQRMTATFEHAAHAIERSAV